MRAMMTNMMETTATTPPPHHYLHPLLLLQCIHVATHKTMTTTPQPLQHLIPTNKHSRDVIHPVVHTPKVHSMHHNSAVVSPIPANQWTCRACCPSTMDRGCPALPPPPQKMPPVCDDAVGYDGHCPVYSKYSLLVPRTTLVPLSLSFNPVPEMRKDK